MCIQGIRFLDFRVGFATVNGVKDWYGVHTAATSKPAIDYVQEMYNFLAENPGEILFVWISEGGATDLVGSEQYPGVNPDTKRAFWKQIKDKFEFEGSKVNIVNNTQFPWNGNDTTINNLVHPDVNQR